jgi:hypothetical protein
MKHFTFAVGIECSYPVVQGGSRRDMFLETDHYRCWQHPIWKDNPVFVVG